MTCPCTRIVDLGAKCSDMFSMSYQQKSLQGYVPSVIGIGGGDYVEFKYCLDCGKIQNFKRVEEETMRKIMDGEEYDE